MCIRIKIVTKDRYALSARHFIPATSVGHTVIINAATGVKQTYYSQFADYLSMQGFHVYTYDYRGIGESRSGLLKELCASIVDWGELDLSAIIRYVKERHPSNALTILGHSIGGQILGISPLAIHADNLVMIGSQTPYWKNFEGAMQGKVWLMWHVIIPFFTKVCKYFPARNLGLFEDLPREAALQWARWGKSAHYLFDELPEKKETFKSLTQPSLVYSFSDDTIAPLKAVNDLLKHYANLRIEHRHIQPDQINKKTIGHFYFFRKDAEKIFWEKVSTWIREKVPLKVEK